MIETTSMPHLTWGLAIATKDRIDELCICVEKALGQTRPPIEIIVADNSDDWQSNEARIQEIVGDRARVQFIEAVIPSVPAQRNQAIDAAQADIVFMIDDDSFMYYDCAEKIMAVYEADIDERVAGAQAVLSDLPPDDISIETSQMEAPSGLALRSGRFLWFMRNILLMGSEKIFIPYHKKYPDLPVPKAIEALGGQSTRLFHGARMTFRRSVISKIRFDSILLFGGLFDELDASHRAAHHGALVTVSGARLYHHMVAKNRMQRMRITWSSMLNHAVLLKRHAGDKKIAQRQYFGLMRRRIFAELIKDVAGRRFDFPQLRGSLNAWRDAKRVFSMTEGDLENWYSDHQYYVVKGKPNSASNFSRTTKPAP